jgi:thiol-disulfide isomerase/thioredoxin
MNNILLQRRKLLFYLGLGITGTGIANGCDMISKGISSANQLITASAKSGSSTTSTEVTALPPPGKPLPEFQGIQQWLNSKPLSIADLKGKVVLVQFWTFACINCQRTLPYVTRWHRQYADKGLRVIGVHTPEFAFEREPNNIKQAMQKHGITYPVPIDNDFKTWKAYNNGYWPHLFLADRQGLLRYDHVGEGAYDKTEQTIRQLVG